MTADKDLLKRRHAAVTLARKDLLTYVQLLHPTAENPDDPAESQYELGKHHKAIAEALAKLERARTAKRLIIVMPPRHGKTELATKSFVPWFMGRHPNQSTIVATYSDTFGNDLGRAIRANLQHPATRQVFPDLQLDKGAKSVSRMETTKRGAISVVGRGSAITGRGGDLLLVDDPLKDRKEADSPTIRDSLWSWFNQVFLTRLMTDNGKVVLIQTRWHEDDLVGRLTDPKNPCYSALEAKQWQVIHLPAIAGERDPLGRKPGAALWPKRFGLRYLRQSQRQDPRGFSALYQGEPNPPTGSFFQEHALLQYSSAQMPDIATLRWYMASDHAVSTAQDADRTCIMLVGMDSYGTAWVHPHLTWDRMTTDTAIEAALWIVEKFKPLFWFAERGVISKSIGPFLRKRMLEKQVFASIREFSPIVDKQARAQSIAARMTMGTVKFPGFATWWPDAKAELMSFPHGRYDDFVDALSLFGLGLDALTPAEKTGQADRLQARQPAEFGTLAWAKQASRQQAARRRTARAQGW